VHCELQESATAAEQQGLRQAQLAAQHTQEQLQHCAEALRGITHLQQGLQDAIAAARQKAEAASAQLQSETDSDSDSNVADLADMPQQQGARVEEAALPVWDAAAAAAELQPLVLAEQGAFEEVQKQRGVVQELRGQLAAAAARRRKYEHLQGVDNSSGGSRVSTTRSGTGLQLLVGGDGSGGSSDKAHVCEQCLQPINVKLYKQ
jgi:hypothetical protein